MVLQATDGSIAPRIVRPDSPIGGDRNGSRVMTREWETRLEGLRRGKRSLGTELVNETQFFHQDGSQIVLRFDD
jgi:hypothetical protein